MKTLSLASQNQRRDSVSERQPTGPGRRNLHQPSEKGKLGGCHFKTNYILNLPCNNSSAKTSNSCSNSENNAVLGDFSSSTICGFSDLSSGSKLWLSLVKEASVDEGRDTLIAELLLGGPY